MISSILKNIIKPQLDKNSSLELKTVFKWMLSNTLNQLPNFSLLSTINEDENTVIVNLEIDYKDSSIENVFSTMLGPHLHINPIAPKANRNKKVKIDLSDPTYVIKWNAGVVSKVPLLSGE